MTERTEGNRGTDRGEPPARCVWCRRTLPEPATTGRPRRYCRRSCRQRAFEARRRLVELSWGEDRLRGLAERLDAVSVHLAGLEDLVRELRQDVDDGRADLGGLGGGRGAEELVGRLEVLVADLRDGVDRGGNPF